MPRAEPWATQDMLGKISKNRLFSFANHKSCHYQHFGFKIAGSDRFATPEATGEKRHLEMRRLALAHLQS